MIGIAPFCVPDAFELILQPAQLAEVPWHDRRKLAQTFADAGNAFTVRDDAGRVLFCGGAVERHAGYATLWGMFALNKRTATFRLLRTTRQFIDNLPHARVDAMVEDRPAARRWAVMVGLAAEVRLPQAAPGGGDMLVYRRMG